MKFRAQGDEGYIITGGVEFLVNDKSKVRGFEIVDDDFRKHPNVEIQKPKRGTKGSSCYDIYTPVDIVVPPHSHSDLIPMDIRAYMLEDEVLMIYVRSSIGCKRRLIISNCTPVIDSDYYFSKNQGNIHLMFFNTSGEEVVLKAGERVAQGMFTKYLLADDDDCNTDRVGGIGSTGRE